MHNYLYILIAFAVIYAIRVLPLTLIRKPLRSRFLRSFLYYVPYVTLAVMTFPAIVEATQVPLAGVAALIAVRQARRRAEARKRAARRRARAMNSRPAQPTARRQSGTRRR